MDASARPGAGPLDLVDFAPAAIPSNALATPLDEDQLWRQALAMGVHTVRGAACGAESPAALRVCWGAAASDEEAWEAGARLTAAAAATAATAAARG